MQQGGGRYAGEKTELPTKRKIVRNLLCTTCIYELGTLVLTERRRSYRWLEEYAKLPEKTK